MDASPPVNHSPVKFIVLVFVISIPFWVLGSIDAIANFWSKAIPINLPISALMLVCPIIAAVILTYREQKFSGVKHLLGRVFDYKRISHKIWYLPVVFLMPVIMVLSYVAMRLLGIPLPDPQIPFLMIPIFFIVFFIGAIGEEVGWSGYAIDPMQNRWGALNASLILGAVWGIWHVVPFIQTHNTLVWIAGQCLGAVGLRVIIVWLYNNTGKSVFAAILFHTTINVSEFLFPNYGSHYNPIVTGIIMAIIAIVVTFLWGPKTLARYKFSRSRVLGERVDMLSG